MKLYRLIILVFLIAACRPLFGVNLVCDLKNFSYEDGLSHSTITGIFQDQRGLMWFSTWNGLSSYDGYFFQNFRPYPGDGCTMMNSRINKIALGGTGDIWCINQDLKAYLFDVKQHKFLDVLQKIQAEMHQNHTVKDVFPLPKGVTWIVCNDAFSFRVNDEACKSDKNKSDTVVTAYGNMDRKLKGNEIYTIAQDSEGDEWILTDKGVSIIGKKKLNSDFPFHFFYEINRTIWLGTADGRLAKYLPEKQSFRFVPLPNAISKIFVMQHTGKNELTLGTNQGLVLLNCTNLTYRHISVKTSPGAPNDAQMIFKDSRGDYWVLGAQSGIIHLNGTKAELLQSPLFTTSNREGSNRFYAFEDSEKRLWLVPRDGEFCYFDRGSRSLKLAYNTNGVPVTPLVRACFLDKQGNFWCGSNTTLQKISIFYKSYEVSNFSTGEAEVRAMMKDRYKRFWIASKDGRVRVYDSSGAQFKCLSSSGVLTSGDAVFGSNVYDIKEDASGNIWLGTKLNGLYLLTPKGAESYTVAHYTADLRNPRSLSGTSVYSIFQDSKNRVWVGTFEGGLNLVTKDAAGRIGFINYNNSLKNYPFQHAKGVRHIAEKGGVLFLATTNGLILFSSKFDYPEEIQFYRNSRRPDDVTSLSGNDIMYIFTDSRNDTYLITQNAGINLIESDNLLSDKIVFKVYNERNGLASDLTRTMIEDAYGKLWLISKHMITRFDPKRNLIDNYGSYSFRQSFVFSESAVLMDSKGHIVLGTSSGLFRFDPKKMKKKTYVPPIILTGLKIQGTDIPQDAERLQELVLKPSQRNVIIQFAALDYQGSDQIRYAYMLEGVENSWHKETTNPSAVYLNLPHGKHRFLVRSTNSDGAWVNNVRTLTIVVKPTFWETPWSWLLLLLLVAGIVVVVVRVLFTIYRLRHEVDVEQQMSDIKLRFFTDVSHELRTPLTLIAGPLDEVLDSEPLTEKAKQHLTLVQKNVNRLLLLINQILDFRKIQNKRMNMQVEETDILVILRKILENFSQIAVEKSITLSLDCMESTVKLWVDKDKFEKIMFNLLSNAFKYTHDGKSIVIKVLMQKENVRISVFDQGIGIPENKLNTIFKRFEMIAVPQMSHESSGIGLSLVKELVELHHGSIQAFSKQNEGSEFRMLLLQGKDHFVGEDQTEFILSDQAQPQDVQLTTPLSEENDPFFEENEEGLDHQTILVVEDNLELLQFIKDIFSKDFRVITAVNGQEGFEKTLNAIPDLIVCDVMMPVMDGLEMIRQIKENKDVCHIPIIILSAKDSLDDRIIGLERGIDDYITKPFSASYLKARIRTLLKQRKSIQEAFLASLTLSMPSEMKKDQHEVLNLMPADPKIVNFDEQLIQQLLAFMEENMDNSALTVDDIAQYLSMSRTVFYKKSKSLFGVTPIDLIKDIRVKRSVQLIEGGGYSFSEIAYMSGFSDPNYFGKCFKKRMGVTPSKYKEKLDAS